jgi:succinate dehydrogenase / fumarate reductase cytochrome b subunit
VKKQRPVNLDLNAFSFPLPALLSITHRVSGVFLFVGIGLLIWLLGESLESAQSFAEVKETMASPMATFALWVVLAALAYHTVVGVKHLFMDAGLGETLEGGLMGAKIAAGAAVVLILLAGVWVW